MCIVILFFNLGQVEDALGVLLSNPCVGGIVLARRRTLLARVPRASHDRLVCTGSTIASRTAKPFAPKKA